jgi:integrase/recombinase XerC
MRELAAPSVKQRLAAIRHLFDWLVTGQVVPVNPAGSVRGPRHVVTCGQTPVLDPTEARALLDSIDTAKVVGLRDRALIGLMVYSFARIGAPLGMSVEDVFTQNRRLWVRLREKGGKRQAMPCHHNLEEYLIAYLDGTGLRGDPKGPLFRTVTDPTTMLEAHLSADLGPLARIDPAHLRPDRHFRSRLPRHRLVASRASGFLTYRGNPSVATICGVDTVSEVIF